ncbi:superoxide dismutase family protein [Salinimonas lutimaris]|uniref:superoxide dismutase family protein n=1 Tax=Salinimonas lutimaris TaxID=914153 RepID=UPI0010BF6726|nr:superoxide dismutase family protein [Salinimonas lutimaris]
MHKLLAGLPLALSVLSAPILADDEMFAPEVKTIKMTHVQSGKSAGMVKVEQTDDGLVLTPSLTGLKPGGHGFHVHENPSCDSAMKKGESVPAGAAGSHYDPEKTKSHGYPWAEHNHLGDLPLLYVNDKGEATTPVLAPRLDMDDLKGRALMVHEGGDNYSDSPQKLGGGGPRVACGVI